MSSDILISRITLGTTPPLPIWEVCVANPDLKCAVPVIETLENCEKVSIGPFFLVGSNWCRFRSAQQEMR